MNTMPYFGNSLHESEVKRVLQKLNQHIHFDMGGNLNFYHPKIDQWQGIFYDGRHIATLQRGTIPEFNVYRVIERKDEEGRAYKVRGEILFVGWRTTLEHIANENIPGVTVATMCAALNVDHKKFTGDPRDLEVA